MKNNTDIVLGELERQFSITEEGWSGIDRKFEILLGINISALTYLVTNQPVIAFYKQLSQVWQVISFLAPLLLIVSSIFAIVGHKPKEFIRGINVDRMIKEYKDNPTQTIVDHVIDKLYEGVSKNSTTLRTKVHSFYNALNTFLVGMGVIIFVKFYFIIFS